MSKGVDAFTLSVTAAKNNVFLNLVIWIDCSKDYPVSTWQTVLLQNTAPQRNISKAMKWHGKTIILHLAFMFKQEWLQNLQLHFE